MQAIKQCAEVSVLLNGYNIHKTKSEGYAPRPLHGWALNSESCHQDCVVLWAGSASLPWYLLLPMPTFLKVKLPVSGDV